MVHQCICIKTVCVCMQSGVVNHAECALALPPLSCPCAPFGVQPLMAIDMVERTLFYTHTFTLQHRTGEQPPADPRQKKLQTASTHHSDGSLLIDWLTCVILFLPDTLGLYATTEIVHVCWLQCGCLDSAARDRVYKDGARRFFVCWLSACVKDTEAWRFGPWVGKVGRMRLGSQSLWCYC